jgi:hypothetical protein
MFFLASPAVIPTAINNADPKFIMPKTIGDVG